VIDATVPLVLAVVLWANRERVVRFYRETIEEDGR